MIIRRNILIPISLFNVTRANDVLMDVLQIQLDQLLEFKAKWLTQQADLKNQLKHAQDALSESNKKIDDELGPLQDVCGVWC